MRGCFITVEGQDGAGKTTNLEFIQGLLERHGVSVLRTREPGGTPLGEALRDILLHGRQLNIDPLAELLTMFAARAQHLNAQIRPALDAGRWVLCDRFTDASYAYQGGGRGVDEADIRTLETVVLNGLAPDLTILLDVDIETGRARTTQRGEDDRFESEAHEFKQRVRKTYLALARKEPGRIRVVDATASLAAVKKDIESVLEQLLRTRG